jgi:inosine/xanthosine triphosphatase
MVYRGYFSTCLQASRLPVTSSRFCSQRWPLDAKPPLQIDLVIVGSANPVKVAAVQAVIARIAPNATVRGLAVASGVPDQPIGDEETQAGARQRALAALASTNEATLAVGLEGGVVVLPDGRMRSCAWAVVVDRDGQEGIGGSLSMPLPDQVAARIRAGEELGHAMDALADTVGTKHGRGAVGILTAGLVDRQRAYEPMVAYALAPWLAPAFFAA